MQTKLAAWTFAGSLCAVSAAARAESGMGYELGWERGAGAESCPDSGSYVLAVRERIGRDPFMVGSTRRIDVSLSRTDTEWHATLRTSNAGVIEGAQELKSEGETCRTLFSAVVAVTAVMLGDAKPSASSPEPAPVRLSEEPAPKPARPVLDSRMSPAGRSDSVMADRAERSDGRAGRRARQFAIGLELLQDFGFAGGSDDVCAASNPRFECYDSAGSRVTASDQTLEPGRLAGGLTLETQRVLLTVHRRLSGRLGLDVRAGRAFGETGPNFMPWHFEAGVRYWLDSDSGAVSGYVAASAGLAEFHSVFDVAVTLDDCSAAADPAACLQNPPSGIQRVKAVTRRGLLFAGPRVGMVFNFAEQQVLTLSMAADVTFPLTGVVLEPTAGYSVEF